MLFRRASSPVQCLPSPSIPYMGLVTACVRPVVGAALLHAATLLDNVLHLGLIVASVVVLLCSLLDLLVLVECPSFSLRIFCSPP